MSSETSPAGLARRIAVVITTPVWMWIFFAAALVSGIHSSVIWLRTGVWLPGYELTDVWVYRLADRVQLKIIEWCTS
jgi:hypothetical protein